MSFLIIQTMEPKIRHFSSHEAYELLLNEKVVLLDIREEYLQGFRCIDVPRVVQIPLSELERESHFPET